MSMNTEEMIHIAQVSRKNGSSTQQEQQDAIESAQAANVTYFNYIRARLFLDLADDRTETVKNWLSEIEYGDFADNCQALDLIRHRMANGERELGLKAI